MSWVTKSAMKAISNGLTRQDVQKVADQKAKAAFVLLIIACGMWYFAKTPVALLPLVAAACVGGLAYYKSEVSSRMIDLQMSNTEARQLKPHNG